MSELEAIKALIMDGAEIGDPVVLQPRQCEILLAIMEAKGDVKIVVVGDDPLLVERTIEVLGQVAKGAWRHQEKLVTMRLEIREKATAIWKEWKEKYNL